MTVKKLRPAEAGDSAAVWALWRACAARDECLWNDDYPTEAFLKHDMENGFLYVLDGESGLVGTVTLMPTDDLEKQGYPFRERERVAVLTRIGVQPALWRKGEGSALLALAETEAARRGAEAMHLLCDVRNVPGLALFARAGYRKICEASLYGDRFFVLEKVFSASGSL